VTIDGLFDAGYQSNTLQGVHVSGIEGNGAGTSQFNLRGTEDLGGGLTSSFHLETDFSAVSNAANTGSMFSPTTTNSSNVTTMQNNGAVGRFGNGEIAVGLGGGFGKVQFGAVNNAGLEYVAMVAPIFGTALGGGYGATIGADSSFKVVRWANSVRYDSPTYSGFQASYIYAAKQNNAMTSTTSTSYSATMGMNNVAGASEVSARYVAGPLKLLYVNSTTQQSTGVNDKQIDLGVSYNISDAFAVQAGSQNTQQNSASTPYTTTARTVGAVYTVGQNRFIANVTSLANTKNGMTNATETGLGYDYLLSKTTKVYFRADRLTDSTAASYAGDVATSSTGGATLVGATSGQRTFTKNAVGVRMDF
jgi:predicted porin